MTIALCLLLFILGGCSSQKSAEYQAVVKNMGSIQDMVKEADIIQERIDTKTNSSDDIENINKIDSDIKNLIYTISDLFDMMDDSEKIDYIEYIRSNFTTGITMYMQLVIEEDESSDRSSLFLRSLMGNNAFRNFGQLLENENAPDLRDYFVGEWYCSKRNSVNDMEITLTFSKKDDDVRLYYERNMTSEDESNIDSFIEGSIIWLSQYTTVIEIEPQYLKDGYIRLIPGDENQYLHEYVNNKEYNEYRKIK